MGVKRIWGLLNPRVHGRMRHFYAPDGRTFEYLPRVELSASLEREQGRTVQLSMPPEEAERLGWELIERAAEARAQADGAERPVEGMRRTLGMAADRVRAYLEALRAARGEVEQRQAEAFGLWHEALRWAERGIGEEQRAVRARYAVNAMAAAGVPAELTEAVEGPRESSFIELAANYLDEEG